MSWNFIYTYISIVVIDSINPTTLVILIEVRVPMITHVIVSHSRQCMLCDPICQLCFIFLKVR